MSIDDRVRAAGADARHKAASAMDTSVMLNRLHRMRRRRSAGSILGALAVIAAVVAGGVLISHSTHADSHPKPVSTPTPTSVPQTCRAVRGGPSPCEYDVGAWVDSLPSGQVARAAWVDGDVLHVGSDTVPITGPGVSTAVTITVYAETRNGWFASVEGVNDSRLGVIHPDGTFVAFPKYEENGVLVSPDGSQAVAGADGGGLLIDTATGRVIMREPGIYGIAWTSKGILAYKDNRTVLWKPGIGISTLSFDRSHCDRTEGVATVAASFQAGFNGCTIPKLVSVSPDGTKALVGKDVVDLGTGQQIQFAPKNPFQPYGTVPSFAVLWDDNEHVLIEVSISPSPHFLREPTRLPKNPQWDIVRCNVVTGSCERASDPVTAWIPGIAPLN
jgi:hypothetical protein